jgi:hypothetical protein
VAAAVPFAAAAVATAVIAASAVAAAAELAVIADHGAGVVLVRDGAVVSPGAGTSVVVRERDTTRKAKSESGERDELEHHDRW